MTKNELMLFTLQAALGKVYDNLPFSLYEALLLSIDEPYIEILSRRIARIVGKYKDLGYFGLQGKNLYLYKKVEHAQRNNNTNCAKL